MADGGSPPRPDMGPSDVYLRFGKVGPGACSVGCVRQLRYDTAGYGEIAGAKPAETGSRPGIAETWKTLEILKLSFNTSLPALVRQHTYRPTPAPQKGAQ